MIVIAPLAFTCLLGICLLLPALAFFYRQQKRKELRQLWQEQPRRSLVEEEARIQGCLLIPVDWSTTTSGWNIGKKVDFDRSHVPLIATLQGHLLPNSWLQPAKIGASQLLQVSKSYIEKFGKGVFTLAAVSAENSSQNIAWGMVPYLVHENCRALVLEIGQRQKRKQESTRIDLNSRMIEQLPDPLPSNVNNVDTVVFDPVYTWPEDILTQDTLETFCQHFQQKYPVILIVTPPIFWNGFARKAAAVSDAVVLSANQKDDNANLIDAYLRISKTSSKNSNESLIIWGVWEKA